MTGRLKEPPAPPAAYCTLLLVASVVAAGSRNTPGAHSVLLQCRLAGCEILIGAVPRRLHLHDLLLRVASLTAIDALREAHSLATVSLPATRLRIASPPCLKRTARLEAGTAATRRPRARLRDFAYADGLILPAPIVTGHARPIEITHALHAGRNRRLQCAGAAIGRQRGGSASASDCDCGRDDFEHAVHVFLTCRRDARSTWFRRPLDILEGSLG